MNKMKPTSEMTDAEFERWMKRNKISGLAAFTASQSRKAAMKRERLVSKGKWVAK